MKHGTKRAPKAQRNPHEVFLCPAFSDYAERNARVVELFGLVKPIARRVLRSLPPSFELADLEQHGAIGLMDAAERYDPAHAATFRVYAKMKIRGAILDACSGREYRESTRPSLEYIEEHAPGFRGAGHRVTVLYASHSPSPEQLATSAERTRKLRVAVAKLTPRQRKVIQLRYGSEVTQKEAGRALGGISQAGARELELRAIKGLKRLLRAGKAAA